MPFQSMAMFLKLSLMEHAPRLPSLTCLAHAVEHHMKEIIFHLLHITSYHIDKSIVCMTMTSVAVLTTQNISRVS